MPLTSREIRSSFLRFFEERGHRLVASGSLVPEGDPTLLFTNAGMVPVQARLHRRGDARLHRARRPSQKCMRVSGKHNDLENVGRTPRHHTFFEMLGNFSLRRLLQARRDRLGLGAGDEGLGHPAREARRSRSSARTTRPPSSGRSEVGVPANRITRLDEADNFWQMGDTGPCGPCSEIYFDWGQQPGCPKAPADCDPSCDCGRWLEIWNLVFMQFNRDASGTMTPLPKPSIDTGVGLERVSAVLQGVKSNYDTDLFRGDPRAGAGALGRAARDAIPRRTSRCASSPTTRARSPS